MNHEETPYVKLSEDIYKRVENRADASDFESIQEYVDHILRLVLDDLEPLDEPKDEDEIKSRLQSLGYLDQ